jgi:hypothetical protein
MKRWCLKILSHGERTKINQQLKDAMDVGLIRQSHGELGSPILLVRKAVGSL